MCERKNLILIIITLLPLIFLMSCNSAELKEEREKVRRMEINHVDLSALQDGKYKGDFKYGRYTYVVTGATTTSKALLKAIENALTGGLEQ